MWVCGGFIKKLKTEIMNNEKCELGCKNFHGGEIRHHKSCVFYPGSFTEMYDTLKAKYDTLNKTDSIPVIISESDKPIGFYKGRLVSENQLQNLKPRPTEQTSSCRQCSGKMFVAARNIDVSPYYTIINCPNCLQDER